MKRKCFVVGIILLFIGVAIVPSIHFNVVNASANDKRENEITQKDLLFQTILDVANNKEIQQVILKSQITKGVFFHPDVKFPIFNITLITKSQLKQMYFIGLLLSTTLSKSRMHSLLEQHQMISQKVQKDVTAVLEKNATLNEELRQLSDLKCDCNKDNLGVTKWHFPILCAILIIIINIISNPAWSWLFNGYILVLASLADTLGCNWPLNY